MFFYLLPNLKNLKEIGPKPGPTPLQGANPNQGKSTILFVVNNYLFAMNVFVRQCSSAHKNIYQVLASLGIKSSVYKNDSL